MGFDMESLSEATSGAIGSLLSTTILYPLDTCKTKYQAEVRAQQQQKYRRTSDVFWEAISAGQVLSLYQGLGSKNVQSFVSSFLYFYGYSFFKRLYLEKTGKKTIGTGANLLVATAAGASTILITQPLDTASSRMQTSEFGKSKGLWETLSEGTWKEAFDGLGISLLLTSNPTIQYTLFDQLKMRLMKRKLSKKADTDSSPVAMHFTTATETIPFHRDYQVSLPKERLRYRKISIEVLDELEDLKPEFQRQVKKLSEAYAEAQLPWENGSDRTLCGSGSSYMGRPAVEGNVKGPAGSSSQSSWKYNDGNYVLSSNPRPIYRQFQKLSLGMSVPKKETLSRHSFLGPNGLDGQWLGSSAEIKVQYPSHNDIPRADNLSLIKGGQNDIVAVKDDGIREGVSSMESVLSLDDERWLHLAEESRFNKIDQPREDFSRMLDYRQPSPPPVLAEVHQLSSTTIPPSRVADPRPGPAISAEDHGRSSYQHLHVPVKLMEDFLRLARSNTLKNLETCGVLAGSLKNRVFHISTLIIPKQESTSDSCQTLNEEEIFEIQDKLSLFPLGWIHTHPSQTCFMSSVDLHTHYSYQIMLPEAIAIVMAPTDTTSPHGIFHLSDPGGLSIIRNCQQRGFHPHEEPSDGCPIYEHCSHVYMNSKLKYDVVDLR